MKILFVSPTYRPSSIDSMGGGEKSNILLMEWLANRGHEVVVVAKDTGSIAEEVVNGVRVIGARKYRSRAVDLTQGMFDYRRKIFQVVQNFSPNVVLAATDFIPYAVKIGRKFGAPIGVFLRAYENFRLHSSFEKKFKNFFYGDFFETGLGQLDFVLPNSTFMEEYFRSLVANVPTHVVYPPINVENTEAQSSKEDITSIVLVGTSKKKGIDIFVRLAKAFPMESFKIVGSPSGLVLPEIKNLSVAGWVDVIQEFKVSASLVLVPSEWDEPFGRTAVEAILCGVPVFVSKRGGLPEAVGHNRARIVGDTFQDWHEKIKEFLSFPENYAVSREERKSLSKKYSLECQGRNLETLLLRFNNDVHK